LHSVSARSVAEAKLSGENTDSGGKGEGAPAKTDATSTTPPPGTEKADAATPAKPSADSGKGGEGDPDKAGGKTPAAAAPTIDKRVSEAQNQLRIEREARTKAEKDAAEATRKLNLLNHPAVAIDWEKTEAFVKAHDQEALDQPVTRRELAEKAAADQKVKDDATAADAAVASEKAKQDFIADFLVKNPHTVSYAESGALGGIAQKIAAENPEDDLAALSTKVSEFCRAETERVKRTVAAELSTTRTALAAGGAPPAGGSMPGGSADGEDPGDNPSTYVADRKAARHQRLGAPRL